MDERRMHALADRFLAAWNSQQVERVLDCYTDDLAYRDPNTRGTVEGRDAMRRYLTKLFAGWTMTWHLREAYLLDGKDGCAILWRASFRRGGDDAVVEIDGMDLAVVRGDRLARNDVYFDRAALAPLLA